MCGRPSPPHLALAARRADSVLGHHEDDFMVLAHPSGGQLTTQERGEEMHAGR